MPFFQVDINTLNRLIAIALSRGGDYADLYFEYGELEEMNLRDSKVNSAGKHIDYGVGIRVLKGEQTGYAYSESTEWSQMEKAARAAAAIADNSHSALSPNPLNITTIKGGSYYSTTDNWSKLLNSDKIAYLQKLNEIIHSLDSRITNVSEGLCYAFDRFLFYNSLGEIAEDCGPTISLSVSVVSKDGSRSESASISRSFRMGKEFLSDDLLNELAHKVVDKCSFLFKAKQAKGGKMPVIMNAGGSGIFLHEAIGHSFEADFIRKGTSIFSDSLGKKICNENISVIDDGTIPFN
ncbi:MAG: TldD/PmbA family protein, partial [Bacteroidales bacterium]|nr:TldD/PmbA family protein [Bacteroidales bacterium]